jgi:hypothetical protein
MGKTARTVFDRAGEKYPAVSNAPLHFVAWIRNRRRDIEYSMLTPEAKGGEMLKVEKC